MRNDAGDASSDHSMSDTGSLKVGLTWWLAHVTGVRRERCEGFRSGMTNAVWSIHDADSPEGSRPFAANTMSLQDAALRCVMGICGNRTRHGAARAACQSWNDWATKDWATKRNAAGGEPAALRREGLFENVSYCRVMAGD